MENQTSSEVNEDNNLREEEQKLYAYLLDRVQKQSPTEVLNNFRRLFFEGQSSEPRGVRDALEKLANSEQAEQKFKLVLNRCCYILINRWQRQAELQLFIPVLVGLFKQSLAASSESYSTSNRLRELLKKFTQTEEYLTLQRLARVISPNDSSISATLNDSSISVPLGNLIQRYPYLYKHCLLSEDSSYEYQRTVLEIQNQVQRNFEINLSRYVTYMLKLTQSVGTSQHIQPVKNPTLLSDRELGAALKQFVGKVESSSTYRDLAQSFLTNTITTQSYLAFKSNLYEYLITSIEPEYGRHQFNQRLYKYLQNTFSEFDAYRVDDTLLLRTCNQLFKFLVESPQRPEHLFFIDLIANVGSVRTTGLLLKIVLLCRTSKPYLEKRFSLLFNHYESVSQEAVIWLVDFLENIQIAFSTHFGVLGLSDLTSLINRETYSQTYLRLTPLIKQETYPKPPIVTYDIWLSISPEIIPVGGELQAAVYLEPSTADNNTAYLITILQDESVGSELNIILTAPGFQFDGDNAASLPLDPSASQVTQTAHFSLTAIRPGTATITAELYRGDTFETTLETKVQVTGFDETSFTATRITTQPRPVPQPDFILRVQTTWNETNSTCRFHYQLRSFRLPSLFPGETNYCSDSLSNRWIEQMRGLLGTTLENISDALPEDGRSRLTSLGQYLFKHLLPPELQIDLRSLIPRDRTFTLLILADQDASLPWELLHDGQRFLSDRFIIGRWFWELNDTRPHEFPVGAINVAHYADVEQPELWTALLEPPGSPPPLPLPDGVLGNFNSTEAMRGLHLIRYSQSSDTANRRNAPVTLDDTNNTQDIERQMRPAKLNLRRNRPLVSLGYVRRDRPELTTLEQTWASAFIRAGCSAFTGSLWAVDPAVEAAFISGFYNRLWTGDSLGEAFHASRQLARAVAPDSLDWLAYVLFGDPMARPYRPVEGKGYAVVEPIGREIDDPLPPGVPVRFRLSLRRTPPVWHEERVIEVAENLTFENLQAHVKTFGLQVTPDSPIAMSLAPSGNYLGWFTLVAPPEMAGNSALVQVFLMDGMLPIHSLMFSLNIENEEGSSA